MIGFVDITNPRSPRPLGTVAVGGEPTSVAVRGGYAYAGVNTSPDYVNPSGKLVQIRISSRAVTGEVDLGGQPDAVAISPDGQYLAVAIENERDEDLGEGEPPQMPAGYVQIVEMATMAATKVELTGLAGLVYGIDPEPEFVAINEDNLLVVTLQENNGIVMIDCATKQVVNSFSAGSVDLSHIDVDEEDVISQTKSLASVRIPALCGGRCGRRLGVESVYYLRVSLRHALPVMPCTPCAGCAGSARARWRDVDGHRILRNCRRGRPPRRLVRLHHLLPERRHRLLVGQRARPPGCADWSLPGGPLGQQGRRARKRLLRRFLGRAAPLRQPRARQSDCGLRRHRSHHP